ncbi:6999_t:CDS:1 [Paraglomus brasilianum]|uniref:6999_t:CDS:1 n=1 Tax=Paraglomus brasilianum TaxID=144538 RepID=A0A9N8YYV9_9GLOM|nr:6999_t:CDS:1 [Paraglomus brasilianum]
MGCVTALIIQTPSYHMTTTNKTLAVNKRRDFLRIYVVVYLQRKYPVVGAPMESAHKGPLGLEAVGSNDEKTNNEPHDRKVNEKRKDEDARIRSNSLYPKLSQSTTMGTLEKVHEWLSKLETTALDFASDALLKDASMNSSSQRLKRLSRQSGNEEYRRFQRVIQDQKWRAKRRRGDLKR